MKRFYLFVTAIFITVAIVFTGCRSTPEKKAERGIEKKENNRRIIAVPMAIKKERVQKKSPLKKVNKKEVASSSTEAKTEEVKKKVDAGNKKDNIKILNEGEIYVVGRIKLLPPLSREERLSYEQQRDALKDKVFVYFSDQFIDITRQRDERANYYQLEELNEHFLFKVKAGDKLYYSGSTVPLKYTEINKPGQSEYNYLYLPGDKVYMLKPGAKAVYVGTLRYYRNKENRIDRVSYLDEFKKAKKLLKEITGNSDITLHRVRQVKEKGLW